MSHPTIRQEAAKFSTFEGQTGMYVISQLCTVLKDVQHVAKWENIDLYSNVILLRHRYENI